MNSDDLHKCEVQSVIRRYYPDNRAAAQFFEDVEKKRGHLAAQRLRNDCRIEWMKKKAEK